MLNTHLKLLIIFFVLSSLLFAQSQKKKVVYINSYHSGYFWSDSIEHAILDTFNIKQKDNKLDFSQSLVELKIFYMNSKRKKSIDYLQKKSLEIKNEIEAYNPDIIITSDDNAVKYLIQPYFYNHKIPVIFSGINGDASVYGFPTKNITGMLEVELIKELIDTVLPYAKGHKIGYLDANNLSEQKTLQYLKKRTNLQIKPYLISDMKTWRESFLKAQNEVDILIIGNAGGIENIKENYAKLAHFVEKNLKIPTIGWSSNIKDFLLLTFETQPEEQGIWVATKALKVLKGKDIRSIAIENNKEAAIFLNTTLAKKLKIIFPVSLIENATLITK